MNSQIKTHEGCLEEIRPSVPLLFIVRGWSSQVQELLSLWTWMGCLLGVDVFAESCTFGVFMEASSQMHDRELTPFSGFLPSKRMDAWWG